MIFSNDRNHHFNIENRFKMNTRESLIIYVVMTSTCTTYALY